MSVLLCMKMIHVQVPQTQVTVCGAGDEHLTAGSERAGHYTGVSHRTGPEHHQTYQNVNQTEEQISFHAKQH